MQTLKTKNASVYHQNDIPWYTTYMWVWLSAV